MKVQAAFRLLPSVHGVVSTRRGLSLIHSLLQSLIHLMTVGEGLLYHVLMITVTVVAYIY